MACNGFAGHIGSDGSTVSMRVAAQGYISSWPWVGENYYVGGSVTPQSTFTWWMNSELHRNNLLHASYTEIGIGYIYESSIGYGGHFTAVFARP